MVFSRMPPNLSAPLVITHLAKQTHSFQGAEAEYGLLNDPSFPVSRANWARDQTTLRSHARSQTTYIIHFPNLQLSEKLDLSKAGMIPKTTKVCHICENPRNITL
ncbi:hypothetical protein KIN20_031924 [Parelaphostrongylus tenuis]|uniref:Uncharacterized protein n=1 Tax=Parelaphostrongylus tenuis TaxID=148309 RepID=A0AAD5WHM2_PARTN|nr:hypothetical protein KIN20_031924 [Parelaphostrongylus tenuis]